MAGTRSDAFNAEARRQANRLAPIQQRHVRAVVVELERAQRRIERLVRAAIASGSAAGSAHWQRLQREIDAQLALFRRAAAQTTAAGIEAALSAGRELMPASLASAGFAQLGPEFRLNPRAIGALRHSALGRIQDVTDQARRRIRAAISQGVIGALRLDQVVDRVNRLLGGNARRRAMTIAYTEIGRAYSVASYEGFQRAADLGVKLALRWQKSGKVHPRASHVAAHDQLVRFGTKFSIVDTKTGEEELLRFPRDPEASAGNSINCGCLAVPVVDGSSFDVLDRKTGEVSRRVVVLPDDPKAPPQLLTLAERAQQNRALLDRVQARLRAAGIVPGPQPPPQGGVLESLLAQLHDTPGLAITTAATAVGALASTSLETQIALWWEERPRGTQAVGAVSVGVIESLGARSASVSLSPWTWRKQRVHHPELTAEDYARLPALLREPREVFAVADRHVAVVAVGGALWLAILKTDRNGRIWLQSFRRTSEADIARLRKRRSRPGGGFG